MITIKYSTEDSVEVFISRAERINFNQAIKLMRKGRRMIQQNKASSLLVEFENTPLIDKNALAVFNRVLWNKSKFPVTIINS